MVSIALIWDWLGTFIVCCLLLAMILAFPFSEFARGMATNPAAHRVSKGAAFLSLVGVAIAAALIWG